MLSKFLLQNFRSFGEEPLVLDMVSEHGVKSHAAHVCRPVESLRVLRNAAIYGANAAGKSTIVHGLSFMKAAVLGGMLPQGALNQYCRAGAGYADKDSTFEIQFTSNGRAYDYGFTCSLKRYAVNSEWLYELGSSQPKVLFRRDDGSQIELGAELDQRLTAAEKTRFEIYRDDFISTLRDNAALLFLPAIGVGKQYDAGSGFAAFATACNWFTGQLQVMGAGQPSPTSEFYSSSKTLDDVARVLGALDTGISGLSKREISLDDLEKYVDFGVAMTVRQFLAAPATPGNSAPLALTVRTGASFIGVEKAVGKEPKLTVLDIRHKGSSYGFDFGEESDGTKRLFDFMDFLFSRRNDCVFVVDEIDRSLHPMLTEKLIELFNEVHKADLSQLIFTTHESGLMDFAYFLKDEIWFVDRDGRGESHLYSLADFDGVRSDARLAKNYLNRRYGGVPVLEMGEALAALSCEEAANVPAD